MNEDDVKYDQANWNIRKCMFNQLIYVKYYPNKEFYQNEYKEYIRKLYLYLFP